MHDASILVSLNSSTPETIQGDPKVHFGLLAQYPATQSIRVGILSATVLVILLKE